MTIKKLEGHLQILQWMYILAVTSMALITADFILTMSEKCLLVAQTKRMPTELLLLSKFIAASLATNLTHTI